MDEATTLTLQGKSGSKRVDFTDVDMVAAELAEFGRCVRSEMQPETDAAVGLAALRVVRGAIAAHEQRQWIEV
jgi:predicted dehydrogenase